MKIRMNKGYFFVLIITFLFVGASIIYHANITKPLEPIIANETDAENSQELADLNSKFIELDSKMINLNSLNKEILPPIEQYIIGGGYEYEGGKITEQEGSMSFRTVYQDKCESWGEANCLDNEIICPENYTKFNSGEQKRNPKSSIGVKNWFICVK